MTQQATNDDSFTIELSRRVSPGEHDAVVLSHRVITKFRRRQVEFRFRLLTEGRDHGAELPGYCALPEKGKLPGGSKLARWWGVIVDFNGGPLDRLSLDTFRNFWFRVNVATVAKDSHGKKLPGSAQYEVVKDITAIAGKLASQEEEKNRYSTRRHGTVHHGSGALSDGVSQAQKRAGAATR